MVTGSVSFVIGWSTVQFWSLTEDNICVRLHIKSIEGQASSAGIGRRGVVSDIVLVNRPLFKITRPVL